MDRSTFRRGVEARELDLLTSAFAEDGVLHSPITFHPFEGKPAIRTLLRVILAVFEDFRYTDELTAPDGTIALVFRARVRDRDLEGVDLLRFDADGFVRDATILIRPRSAMEAILAEVGPRLAVSHAEG